MTKMKPGNQCHRLGHYTTNACYLELLSISKMLNDVSYSSSRQTAFFSLLGAGAYNSRTMQFHQFPTPAQGQPAVT